MRINGSISDLYGPGGFPRNDTRVERGIPDNPSRAIAEKKENRPVSAPGEINLQKTLSKKEISTLHALFGELANSPGRPYGGQARVKGIHAGMLLDLKG